MGDLIYFPGWSPEDIEKRRGKLEVARANLFDIFDHLGLEEHRVEYLEILKQSEREILPLTYLEKMHRNVSKSLKHLEDEQRILLRFDVKGKTGRYVGYHDRDTNEFKKYEREEVE